MWQRIGRQAWTLPAIAMVMLLAATGYQLQAQDASRHSPLRAAYMRAHFGQVMVMHDAIARGDLAGARAEAAILAEQSPSVPMPVGAAAFQGTLTRTAREAATAPTLASAAQSAAAMLGTCGQCHQAMQVRAAIPTRQDIKVGGLVGHMLLHQYGSDALIEGLVGPSDAQWGEGVRTFASPKLGDDAVPGRLAKRMREGETALAVLAGHAAQAHRTRERVDIYGRMLATCGECHRTQGRHAGPGAPR